MKYILQQSSTPGYYVCTDTENLIVCVFKEKEFQETATFTPLNDDDTAAVLRMPRAMSEMGNWLHANHYRLLFPLPHLRKWIGMRLAQVRAQQGMSQKELAEMCLIPLSELQNIETGRENTDLNTLALLLQNLNAELDIF